MRVVTLKLTLGVLTDMSPWLYNNKLQRLEMHSQVRNFVVQLAFTEWLDEHDRYHACPDFMWRMILHFWSMLLDRTDWCCGHTRSKPWIPHLPFTCLGTGLQWVTTERGCLYCLTRGSPRSTPVRCSWSPMGKTLSLDSWLESKVTNYGGFNDRDSKYKL